MIKCRLTEREKTFEDKIIKLAGYRNLYTQDILRRFTFYVSPMENLYINLIDRIGLYDSRISFLYYACHRNMQLFSHALVSLYIQHIDRYYIISLGAEADFTYLGYAYNLF